MGKRLIITEKPSVAQQFAKTLHVSGRNNGYIENDKWIITWCVGHLVTLSYPEVYDEKYARWALDDLPFLPDKYLYEVIKSSKDQYKVVKELLNRADVDEILNAGDSGREGEYIQRLVFMQTGADKKKKFRRVWIDSQTDAEILRGIKEAKPASEYDNLAAAAYMRGIEDYSIGINLSRALSCKFGYQFNQQIGSKKYVPISVGRVMTCVLGMIVNREREIRNFKPVDYYRVSAVHNNEGFTSSWKYNKEGSRLVQESQLYNESGFLSEVDCDSFISALSQDPRLKVEAADRKVEKKNAPLLYNLAELQNECSKKFKIDPDTTLAVAQELYEAKLTTYPRTDARVISTAVAAEVETNISGLKDIEAVSGFVDSILQSGSYKGIAKSKYCDDSKITDHYAIIPTGSTDGVDNLSELSASVYELIVRRFLAIFLPAAEYDKISLTLLHSTGERFYASEKVMLKPGYLEVYKSDDEDEVDKNMTLSAVKQGDVIDADFQKNTSTTQPPKRYTSGSLILAMENAGNLIEEEELRAQIKGQGIGTSATRAATIKKLCTNGYINLNDKTQVITPTQIGEAVVDIVNETIPKMLSPKFTANWEKGLSQVESGQITDKKYQGILEDFIRTSVEQIKSMQAQEAPHKERQVAGACPVCGQDLYETEKGYFCSGRKKDEKKSTCRFSLSKSVLQMLPESEAEKLRRGESTDFCEMPSKSGGTFVARMLVKSNGDCVLDFPKDETQIQCPKCGKMMSKGSYKYECECGLGVWHTMSGKELSEMEIQELFQEMVIGPISGFTSKDGNPYSAYLIFDGKNVCMMKTVIAKRQMSKDDALELLQNGKTDVLSGFVSAKGSEFEAALKISPKGQVEFDFPDSGKKNSGKAGTKSGTKGKKGSGKKFVIRR